MLVHIFVLIDRLPDNMLLEGWMCNSTFRVRISKHRPILGWTESSFKQTESCIMELAEQLAWLGAALGSSPYDRGIAICTPNVSYTSTASDPTSWTRLLHKEHFKVSFSYERLVPDPEDTNGQCWQSLFLNQVLVSGYPITRRAEGVKGLEISLDVMAALLQASCVTWSGGTPFLKGFSALATLAKVMEGTMLWHLVFNENKKERISYNDPRVHRIPDLKAEQMNIANLESARHILGWCSQVKSLTGMILSLIAYSLYTTAYLSW